MDISVQTGTVVYDFGPERGYAMIAEAGFTGVDWNISGSLNRAKFPTAPLQDFCIFEQSLDACLSHYADDLLQIRRNGLRIVQAHAPFPALIFMRPQTLEYSIGLYRRCIEFCEAVGCIRLVVHGISLPQNDDTHTPASIDALNYTLYESLIETLRPTNVTVCLENLFTESPRGVIEGVCSDPHEAVTMIDNLNARAGKDCFGLCLDTGHLNLVHRSFRTYVPLLGQRIKALHIHDNGGVTDQHLLPFSGTVCWNEFCDSLHDIGYTGDLSFETFAQTRRSRLPAELVPLFLQTIAGIGDDFRTRIQA